MNKKSPNNKITGDQFEAYIGTLYQSLGYRLTYNVQLSGQQVDILAEKNFPGAGHSKIAIECKFQTIGKIGNQKVYDFIASSDVLIRNNGVTKSIMVTNIGFTDTAWAAAEKSHLIELITQRSLEDQLFDLASTYKSFVDLYETTEIFNEYVELSGVLIDRDEVKEKVANIEKFLTDWLAQPQEKLMTVFGDFGSGKTTILNRIKYVFAKSYIQGSTNVKPFLINLKDFYKHDTLDKLLVYSALREFEKEVSLELIYRQIETGQIILLLDGFDEMAQQVDTDIRMRNFLHLAPLLSRRAIITCRPSYFVSKTEYIDYSERSSERSAFRESSDNGNYKRANMEQRELVNRLAVYLSQEFTNPKPLKTLELLDFRIIEIETLSKKSIDNYLEIYDREFKRTLGHNWITVKKHLLQIYDISDLMTRPMLLKMIVKTLVSGSLALKGKNSNIGPSALYDTYTSLYLDIDYNKGKSRQLFTVDQRRMLAMSVALLMYKQRSLEVSYKNLLDFVKSHADLRTVLGNFSDISFEQIVSDMQICTFLVASESGNFRFAHKSFMEFFVARFLKQRLIDATIPDELFTMLPKEILYFVGSFSTLEDNIHKKLEKWLKSKTINLENQTFIRNCASAILYEGGVIDSVSWENVDISYIDVVRRTFKDAKFKNVNISNVRFQNSHFFNNDWTSMHLSSVDFNGCGIHGTIWSAITQEMRIVGGEIGNSKIKISGQIVLNRRQNNCEKHQFFKLYN
ncbi:MAG: NACHT domain-containing protein [Sphingobacteriales bacterium]|nr:MAG: NACHT domain-containing protein [Sphingobacteriales bacterium]